MPLAPLVADKVTFLIDTVSCAVIHRLGRRRVPRVTALSVWEATMNRVVRGSDGRMWNIRSNMEWSHPLGGEEFEHDMSGGARPGLMMGAVLVVLAVTLVVWTPPAVAVPGWLIAIIVLLVMFFPARWLARRPWTLVAETPGDQDEQPPERWVGVIRGAMTARQEAGRVARNIEVYAEPDVNGPLQPVE